VVLGFQVFHLFQVVLGLQVLFHPPPCKHKSSTSGSKKTTFIAKIETCAPGGPGAPGAPIRPSLPGIPGGPGFPGSPLGPRSPFLPSLPAKPGRPMLPGSPFVPGFPSMPGRPYKQTILSHCSKLKNIQM
jgi:hypothetical protein